jgi:predicted PurR-regulated permease PerM
MPDRTDPPAPARPDVVATTVRTIVLLAATALGIYICYRLAVPFLPALAWALAFAVLFAPLQRWLEARIRWPSLAASTALLAIGLIVVVPAVLVGQSLVTQAVKGAQLIEERFASGEWRHTFATQPRILALAERIEDQLDLPDTVRSVTAWLSDTAGSIVKGSLVQLIGVCLTFYLLFFFLRDRALALDAMRALSPLTDAQTERLFTRVHDTIFATVYGTLAVASVQGVLGGLMFWWLGLPAPLLWGVVMALLGVVPVLGAFVVWIPAALFLALEGRWVAAIVLTAWGLLVVGTIDNLLRPVLVGNRLKLHTVLAFLSIVGGLLLFGAAGLILGPVVLTITRELLGIWRTRPGARADVDVGAT